jgi:hypothetical protein
MILKDFKPQDPMNLIKVESIQPQSTPNRREMKITSQEINDVFLVFFELK